MGAKASKSAAKAQLKATEAGIAETRRQFDTTRADLMPWQEAGQTALGGLMSLVGLGGDEAQQGSIDQLRGSPLFSSLNRQGEEAILQNASATGGLRGGNTQNSLANFRSDLLAKLIESQYAKLSGISGTGQQTGVQLGEFGQNSAGAIANLLGQGGAAKAGGIIGASQGWTQAIKGGLEGLQMIFGGI